MKTLFAGMVGLAVFGAFAGPADSRGGAAKSERAAPRESNVRRWRELGVLLEVFRTPPPAPAAPPGAYENAPRPAPAQAPDGAAVALHQAIARESAKHNLEPAFVAAVMQVESNFDVCAVSRAGARGLMQLMPATARELGVRDIFDPEQNIEAGVRYLAEGTRLTQGDLDRTSAFYNAGPKSLKSARYRWPRETRRYIEKVRKRYTRFPGDRWKQFTPSFVYSRQCA